MGVNLLLGPFRCPACGIGWVLSQNDLQRLVYDLNGDISILTSTNTTKTGWIPTVVIDLVTTEEGPGHCARCGRNDLRHLHTDQHPVKCSLSSSKLYSASLFDRKWLPVWCFCLRVFLASEQVFGGMLQAQRQRRQAEPFQF